MVGHISRRGSNKNENGIKKKFLTKSLLASTVVVSPVISLAKNHAENVKLDLNNLKKGKKKSGKITFLQTTDVHCQLHTHDELFWENEQVTFRKTGGYAHLATALDVLKKENPENTITLDTGDMFQGSMLAVKTTGQAFVPLLNALNYDMYLLGN